MSSEDDVFARRERARVRAKARAGLFGGTVDPLRIDRFVVQRRLGEGAFGIVYLARDEALERLVAIKVLRRADDPQAEARMLREARAMASLTHPHVVPIYDVGTVDDRTYLAMRYVEGPTLRAWVEQSRPDVGAILATFMDAGRGLAAAHAVGLVHRDFKPDNVLLDADGHVFVGDFGLARIETDADPRPRSGAPRDVSSTATGHVLGTPSYLAPEVIEGAPASAKSDQFAFAVALAEALDGRHPFWGSTPAARMRAITLGKVRPGRRRGPRHVRAAVAKAMRLDPDERFAEMPALLRALAPRERARRVVVIGALAAGAALAAAFAVQTPSTADDAAPGKVDVEVHLAEPAVASIAETDSPPSAVDTATRAVPEAPDGSLDVRANRTRAVRVLSVEGGDALAMVRAESERTPAEAALDRGDYATAIALLTSARQEAQSEHGRTAPKAVVAGCALVRAYLESFDYDAALEAAKELADDAAKCADDAVSARAFALLGVVQLHTRAKDDAPANLAKARALTASDPQAEALADVFWGEGIMLRMKKASRQSVVAFRAGQAIVEAQHGPSYRALVPLLTAEGAALIDIGRPRHAIPPIERAVEIGDEGGDRNLLLARARFFLAMALWDADTERTRAVELAKAAQASFLAHGMVHPRVDAWLEGVGARGRSSSRRSR